MEKIKQEKMKQESCLAEDRPESGDGIRTGFRQVCDGGGFVLVLARAGLEAFLKERAWSGEC